MKRLMCVILSAVMLLSFSAGAFAADDSELTSVVKTAKSRLAIPSEFTEFSSDMRTAAGTNIYSLTWQNTAQPSSEINATILPSGEIVSYYYRNGERDYNKVGIAAFKKEEYLRRAKEWISKVNPSYAAELDTDVDVNIASVHSYNVSLRFGRKINEIPVDGDSVYISLDKYTGDVVSMSSQWVHPAKIASAENLISAEEAGAILGEMSNLELQYKKLRDEAYAVLMYVPASRGMMINAADGEEFTVEFVDSEEGDAGGGANSGAMSDSVANDKAESSLTEEELANIEEVECFLSKKQLSETIKKMAGTAVASFNVKSVNYTQTGSFEDGRVYEARVYLTNADGDSANVTFDAKTGELKSLYTYPKYDDGKKITRTKSRAEMQMTAERFIDTWAADVAEKAEIFGDEDDAELGGYFVFTHSENGIEYAGNSIRIRFDDSTGKILSFSKYWDKEIAFDSAEGVISKEEATAKYIEAAAPSLYYIGNGREIYAAQNAKELTLIYRLSDEVVAYVDAKTGEAYDRSMGQEPEMPEKHELQADLRGHWAESAVKVLADNGIVLSYEETFRPNEAISQKEIALLVDCFEGGYRPYVVTDEDYKSLVESLVRREIIKPNEKRPDAGVTREETVSYLVRMFGFGKAAELSGIYKTGFSDEAQISDDKVGYVAIAKALGLVSGNGGAFNPKRHVTRGELAVMLYNALDK